MENSEKSTASSINGASVKKLLKTVSSPTALNVEGNKSANPTLSQIGKQTSLNVRLSQLYDSGAESGDNDDYTRLIRTPSSRSHKFIIIPSTPAVPINVSSKTSFHQTSSLGNITTSQNTPSVSLFPDTTPTQPIIPKTNTACEADENTISSATPCSVVDNQVNTQALTSFHNSGTITSTITTMTKNEISSFSSNSQTNTAGVTFTIEDYESDNAADSVPITSLASTFAAASAATTIATTYPNHPNHQHQNQPHHRISAINSALSSTPVAIGTQNQLSDVPFNSSATPTLEVNLRPQCARNNSMRSVVSAYYQHDTQYNQYIQPKPVSIARQLSASSCLYRDQAVSQIYSDVISIRSLTSIGIGSTDGRRLVIKKVPQTPTELFNIINPPTPPPPGIDDEDDDSFLDVSDENANLKPRQQHWGSKMQFVLACIGYSVGLGNVWRFPYMCYKSGGGVFLVPYCIILIVCSIPLLFMELSVGQYTGRGPIGALGQLCPLFKGAGLASVVVSFLMSTYYSVIIGYSIYYFFTSFRTEMPWVDCSNRWNTPDCWVPQRKDLNMTAPETSRTPSEEFFENKVLQISPGLEFPGQMRWELFTCLICAWLMVYFATWKSIKSSAKVRYFTATFPFILIIILMGRAVTLDGADEGLRYFFRPNWSELKNANVWINAASQNFNSLGITFGSMISFASYNKYNNNIIRDTVAVSVVNILTSLLVGVFAFATLGNLALEQNTNVRDVIGDGPGLIFVVYPQAMAKMPYAQLWAVMFFFMLLCLGLNSQFAIVEVVVTSIQDGFPNWIKRHLGYHEIVVLFVCVISFLFGLPNLIQGGIYYFQLMDHYAASVTIMFLAFCQMIAVAWLYGTNRLSKNIKQMTGKAPSFYFKSSWVVLGPSLLFAIWVLSLVNYEEPSYHNGRYKYPDWAYGIGWMFASFSLICIPGYAFINLIRAPGSTFSEKLKATLHPNIYECKICGEHHCEHDYPEQEQFMLAQELAGVYKPTTQHLTVPNISFSQKTGYNPMYMPNRQIPVQQTSQQQHHSHGEDYHISANGHEAEPLNKTNSSAPT